MQATSFIVTHDRELAFAVGDRVAVMQAGQILLVGTPAEVQRSPNPVVQQFLTIGFNRSVPK
jgi:ABC-type transporter Mla maintaining outer membrane lipid asymmetry ATPase subunit MlaF